VAVEKLDISEIRTNLGDRKCLSDSRRSFIAHPDAIYFLPISRSEFFNSHSPFHSQLEVRSVNAFWDKITCLPLRTSAQLIGAGSF